MSDRILIRSSINPGTESTRLRNGRPADARNAKGVCRHLEIVVRIVGCSSDGLKVHVWNLEVRLRGL